MNSFKEQIAANSTGSNVSMVPAVDNGIKRRYKQFDVCPETFRKFETGRVKYERWSKYLDETDDTQCAIKKHAQKYKDDIIVLRDSSSGALRAIRRRPKNSA